MSEKMKNRSYDFELLEKSLRDNSEATERALEKFFFKKSEYGYLKIVKDAQKYSLLGGGKRIRPFLVNEVCRVLGGNIAASMPFAIAVEMIHTYSLIHDDLPCMDDDDMRRGKPSNHKVYGEATAVLAGDALLTNAFLAAAKNTAVSASTAQIAIEMISDAAGDEGMIGGQITDIEGENKQLSFDELLALHSMKTGRMIELSATLGCLAAGYGRDTREYSLVSSYAKKIGVVFQAIDDLLDVFGDERTVGKTLASDAENQKNTFLTFFSEDQVREYARKMSDDAISDIAQIEDTDVLQTLAIYLLNRNK